MPNNLYIDSVRPTISLTTQPNVLADNQLEKYLEPTSVETKIDGSLRLHGDLYWTNHRPKENLKERCYFITTAFNSLKELAPQPADHIIIFTTGPNGLLTESILHALLKTKGYNNISWRVINPHAEKRSIMSSASEIENERQRKALLAFESDDTKNVRIFSSWQEYANSTVAEDDRTTKKICCAVFN